MIPGIVALLLVRGCPEDRLDEAFAIMSAWQAADSLTQTLIDVDLAIARLPPATVIDVEVVEMNEAT